MWRFSLARHEALFITSRTGNCGVLPWRNSCSKRRLADLDLHRLTITHSRTSRSSLRLYTTDTSFGTPTRTSWQESIDLTLSDAQRQTIYALSTPPGKGGVAVVRISGPQALHVWRLIVDVKRNIQHCGPRPWKMERCRVVHPETGQMLDDGLAVYFKDTAPKSFTTEDVLELHIHSGRATVSSVLSALACLDFCRPAEPGEFTRRAFEGGRLDLTQAEGLKDLIDAETESQRRTALDAAGGVMRSRFEALRSDIIGCLAMVEALIDFGEGEDIEEGVYEQARELAFGIQHTIQNHLSDNRRGEILRSGIRLAIFGPPNAGKSSLLNFLAQREAAIVTPVPGTTRDILELSLDIGGLPVIVADTAGLRKTEDVVETIGVERAKNAVQGADISLCVLSLPEVTIGGPDGLHIQIPDSVQSFIKPGTCFLFNKADMVSQASAEHGVALNAMSQNAWVGSLSTGQGMVEFLDGFAKMLRERYNLIHDKNSAEAPLITRTRHRVHLESALRFLEAFLATPPEDVVLGAEELRYAAQAVGKVSGLIDVEDILDAVFRDFCIGK